MKKKKDCFNLKILVSKINKIKLNFNTFYETSQCVDKKNKHGYLAHQGAGGRMFIGDNSIYFTTGEFRNRPLAQKKDNDYGKILKTDDTWMITAEKMKLTNNAKFMHCLPIRRNIVASDEVLDSNNSLIIEQANNRTYSAQLVLKKILENG